MSSHFDLCDDSDGPRYTRIATLLDTHGLAPEDVLGDKDSPLILSIGAGRYVSTKDLDRFLHWRAEAALWQRMGRGAPPRPRFEHADEPPEDVPEVCRLPVEAALKSARAEAGRISSPKPAIA
jgi:hypothetical protein